MNNKIVIAFLAGGLAAAGVCLYLNYAKPLPESNNQAADNGGGSAVGSTREILLYYYNPAADKDESKNVMCSRAGLAAVARRIPVTATPIQDAVRLLLKGELTNEEKAAGITTEFPLEGVTLNGANLESTILTLDIADPYNKTSGGSCRAGILSFQIEATAKQFEGVGEVRFTSETLFQP